MNHAFKAPPPPQKKTAGNVLNPERLMGEEDKQLRRKMSLEVKLQK